MSCITKILETKGDKEILKSGEIAIEGGGNYNGYEYIITFVAHGHRCGYVAIPESHPLHSFHKEDYNYPELEVHGGITFFDEPRFDEFTNGHKCTDKWLGFDAGHCYDLEDMERAEKYFGETKWVKYRKENPMPRYDDDCEHRTYEYMESECKNLIDQLIERQAA
jgi:hypothetical protein